MGGLMIYSHDRQENPIIGIIIQARMGSTRLPGKVLLPLRGRPLLEFLIERLKEVRRASRVVVATSLDPRNDPIRALSERLMAPIYSGSEDDVLDRFYRAATENRLDIIVRVTGDCPLTDPDMVDQMIEKFRAGPFDYLNNIDPPTYPNGLDLEVFSFPALERAWTEARAPHHREHVTAYIREEWQAAGFRIGHVSDTQDHSSDRLTIDYEEDYQAIQRLLEHLPERFRLSDILAAMDTHPEIREMNARYTRNEKYERQRLEYERSRGAAEDREPPR
jgi:glutamate-1-semialdehyde 2,1-aminomutase